MLGSGRRLRKRVLVVGFASPPLSQFKEKGKELTLDFNPLFFWGVGKNGKRRILQTL
jgi:hypothetical protein